MIFCYLTAIFGLSESYFQLKSLQILNPECFRLQRGRKKSSLAMKCFQKESW